MTMPLKMSVKQIAGGVIALGLLIGAVIDAGSGSTGPGARNKLTIVAPAAPGGGWDLVARETQQVMRSDSIVNNVQVVNIPGAGGTIGLAQLADLQGANNTLMVTGTVMLGGIEINKSTTTMADVTPIARLADDYEVLVVPADSPFQTIDDFIAAWKQNPGGVSIGGGSAGGTDHLLAGLIAQEVDIDPQAINYISHSGGGELIGNLLSSTVDAGISGFNEFSDLIESGNLRPLAVSAEEPVEGIDIPTMKELGIPVVLTNWRGLVAPPGLTEEDRQVLIDIVTEAAESPEWADTLQRNRWENTFMTGDEFEIFLASEVERIRAIAVSLGLA